MSDATDATDDNTGPGRYVSLDLRLRFSHPLGSLRPYFEALEQGRALGVRCEACARTWFPPRRTCCARSVADNRTELAGAGTVLSITSREPLARELQDYVKQNLAVYKYPRVVEFVDAYPLTSSGKISRRTLRARAAGEAE
jgi:hypothetical protein